MAKFKIKVSKPADPKIRVALALSVKEFEAVREALVGAGLLEGAWTTISNASAELRRRGIIAA